MRKGLASSRNRACISWFGSKETSVHAGSRLNSLIRARTLIRSRSDDPSRLPLVPGFQQTLFSITEVDMSFPETFKYGPAHIDSEIVLAAQSGSISAFEELQKQYSPIIYRKILSITRNREDADDVLQETFLRAYTNLHSFEGRSEFRTWLMQIAINSALMLVRNRRVRSRRFVEPAVPSESEGPSFDFRDSALDPEQTYDQRQRLDSIHRAVEKLEPKLRSALEIWISQGCSMKEISDVLGISLSSVKARLHRARKRLLRSPALRRSGLNSLSAGSGAMFFKLQNREEPCMNCE